MLIDLFKYIIKNITHRFTRSSLTILSILIGIMSIFALISFGQGVSKYIDDMGDEMGTDKLIAQPKGFGTPGSTGTSLSQEDLNYIKKFKDVSEAVGLLMSQTEVKIDENKKGKWVFVMGLPTNPSEKRLIEESFGGIGILKGRDLKKGDYNKINVGYSYQFENKIFSKALKLGDKVYINNERFEIVGFYDEVGNPGDDSNIYMTHERIKTLNEVEDNEEEYVMIYIRSSPGADPSYLAERLEDKLAKKKGQKEGEEDFYIQTFEQLLETVGSVLSVLNMILVIIAGISVLVAAVNIMNTMYTAVLERTKEIGIMKAIGARNSYILLIFFIESGVLGLLGGILGVLLGYGIATAGGGIAAGAGYAMLKPYFPTWLTAGCLVFSFLIGALSGFFPAYQASKQKPVDALRYE
jgi:putative ABC transport system permease protein